MYKTVTVRRKMRESDGRVWVDTVTVGGGQVRVVYDPNWLPKDYSYPDLLKSVQWLLLQVGYPKHLVAGIRYPHDDTEWTNPVWGPQGPLNELLLVAKGL